VKGTGDWRLGTGELKTIEIKRIELEKKD